MEQLKKDIKKLNEKADNYIRLNSNPLKNIGFGMRQVINVVHEYLNRNIADHDK